MESLRHLRICQLVVGFELQRLLLHRKFRLVHALLKLSIIYFLSFHSFSIRRALLLQRYVLLLGKIDKAVGEYWLVDYGQLGQ